MNCSIGCETQYIQVLVVRSFYELLGLDLLQACDLIAKTGGLFIFLFCGGLFHPFHKRVDDVPVLALEKQDGCIDILAVLPFVHDPDTRRSAALDLVLQARPRPVTEKAVFTISNQKQFL